MLSLFLAEGVCHIICLMGMGVRNGGSGLRDYQLEMRNRLFEAWQEHRSVMVQMPTGTGKTRLLAAAIDLFLKGRSHGCVWIVAHRRELVEQVEETIGRYGTDDRLKRVKAMSIQWLVRHWEDIGEAPDLIVVDEAHHVVAESYRGLWTRYPKAKMLGMTATPCRMNHRAFTDLFEVLLTAWPVSEFIRRGYLALFDYVSIRPDSVEQRLIDGLEKRGADGDYQLKEMNAVLNKRPSIERLYQTVEAFAPGKKGIVYAIGIEHARCIADFYRQRGLEAVAIDSKTPAAERKMWVRDFKEGRIQVLVNVDVFSEGFDCPDVEFVQLARPTRSLAKYLQQVGRGLRCAEGKKACVLLDNVGLYRAFGLPVEMYDWEAMFRGLVAGKAGIREMNSYSGCVETGQKLEAVCDCMELVLTHEQLEAVVRKQAERTADGTEEVDRLALRAWKEEENGRWGLMRGRRRTTEAVFEKVFDTGYGKAAVRFDDGMCGLVDEHGTLLGKKGRFLWMKFRNNGWMDVGTEDGKVLYIDLLSLKRYERKPESRKWGGVELLYDDGVYYSRTKVRYVNGQKGTGAGIRWNGYFLSIVDSKAPVLCFGKKEEMAGCLYGHACILEGDNERFYWIDRWLDNGSIVVKDNEGQYYLAEEGKGKVWIGCDRTEADRERCWRKMERIARGAEWMKRKEEREKAEERLVRLEEMGTVTPFKAGMKWGLKAGERVLVPPIYRRVRQPVGRFCAVEKEYCRWGIIAVDGTVVVEPVYAEIAIGNNGTAVLTSRTGKCISVKL